MRIRITSEHEQNGAGHGDSSDFDPPGSGGGEFLDVAPVGQKPSGRRLRRPTLQERPTATARLCPEEAATPPLASPAVARVRGGDRLTRGGSEGKGRRRLLGGGANARCV